MTDSTKYILDLVTAASTIVMAVVTSIYVYLTHKLIRTTKKIAEEQTRPYVVVTLPSRNRKLDLSIKNYGQRPAKNVRVTFDPDLKHIAIENIGDRMYKPLLSQEFLAPGQEVLALVGLTQQIVRSAVEARFDVDITYTDDLNTPYHEHAVIDIRNYVWDKSLVRRNSEDYLGSIAVALAEISESLKANANQEEE